MIHLAVPGLGLLSPAEDFRLNMQGLINVLEAGRLAGVIRVTLASSVAVYGGVASGPFREDVPLRVAGGSPTEVWKRAMENIGLHYGERTGMSVVALRIGLVWGPLYHSMANLPSRFAHAAIKGVASDQVGRGGGIVPFEEDGGDFCYVKDCARGIKMAHMSDNLTHNIYNLSGGRTVTNKELAEAVKRQVPAAEIIMKPGKGPSWRPDPCMDLTHIQQDTGFQPAYDVNSGMADYVAWLGVNPL
jgi:UDP-glucose 4-epimerase